MRRSGSKFGTEDCQPENGLRLPECGIPILGEARLVFDHAAADAHFGASVFWSRRLAALGGEQAAIEFRQTKRNGGLRRIVEIEMESESS